MSVKQKACPRCQSLQDTDNKGRIQPHLRWDWPGYPYPTMRPSSMVEIRCEEDR